MEPQKFWVCINIYMETDAYPHRILDLGFSNPGISCDFAYISNNKGFNCLSCDTNKPCLSAYGFGIFLFFFSDVGVKIIRCLES